MPTVLKSSLLVSLNLLSFLSFFALTTADTPPCNAHDQAVLFKIRDHFGGVNGPLSDWETNSDCCLGYSYVGCSSKPGNKYGRVTGVTFSPNIGLSGTIPSDFGDLPYLSFFTLAGNPNVTGPIPASLAKLSKLNHLDLGHNSLTGSIPPLPKTLTSLDVSNNQLCGPIPSGLSNFTPVSFGHNKCLCGPPLAIKCK